MQGKGCAAAKCYSRLSRIQLGLPLFCLSLNQTQINLNICDDGAGLVRVMSGHSQTMVLVLEIQIHSSSPL